MATSTTLEDGAACTRALCPNGNTRRWLQLLAVSRTGKLTPGDGLHNFQPGHWTRVRTLPGLGATPSLPQDHEAARLVEPVRKVLALTGPLLVFRGPHVPWKPCRQRAGWPSRGGHTDTQCELSLPGGTPTHWGTLGRYFGYLGGGAQDRGEGVPLQKVGQLGRTTQGPARLQPVGRRWGAGLRVAERSPQWVCRRLGQLGADDVQVRQVGGTVQAAAQPRGVRRVLRHGGA